MEIADIHEAQSQLSRLIARALTGEEVIITESGQPMVRLVPFQTDDSPRIGGQWQGRVHFAADFDDLPADIAAAFGVEPRSNPRG